MKQLLFIITILLGTYQLMAQLPVSGNSSGSGNAIAYTGTNYINLPLMSAIDNLSQLTVECWINCNVVTGVPFCHWQASTGNNGLPSGFYINLSGSEVGVSIIAGETVLSSGANIQVNKWYHIACVFDGTQPVVSNRVKIYVNGILKPNNFAFGGTPLPTNIGSLSTISRLGSRFAFGGTFEPMNGKEDEVRVWSKALTQNQIRDGMCKKMIGNETGLMGYWPLDEGTGILASDKQTNVPVNNGTLMSSPNWVLSGAPIGDYSAWQYAPTNIALTYPLSGETFNANAFTGSPIGAHVYVAGNAPSVTSGIAAVGTNNRFFGVFTVDGVNPKYDISYDYAGNTEVVAPSACSFYKRSENDNAPWVLAGASLNPTVFSKSNELIRGEYFIANNPPSSVVVNSPTVCLGQQTATLVASGSSSYTWSAGLSSTTGSLVTGSPTLTATYSVAATNTLGCIETTTTAITVVNTPTITTTSAIICIGQQTASLTASGANSYTWSAGLSSSSGSLVTGNPSATSVYTVTASNSNGCKGANTASITVNTLPSISASVSNSAICIGQQTVTLAASGANSYTWSTNQTASSISPSPTVNTTYTVVGINANGCYNYTTATVQVNNLPVISTNNATICLGQQAATLTVSGANTYTWSTNQYTNSIVQSPSVTTTYSVIGTNSNGCYNYTTSTVFINQLPVVSINTTTICLGQQIATLTASGASTYTWSTNQNTVSIVQSPTVTTTYTVIATNTNNCFSSATTTINVLPLPIVLLTSTIGNTICPSATITLNASGALSYSWFPTPNFSNVSGSSVIASPTANTTYTVVGANGICINETTISIAIANTPSITATSATICSAQSATLAVSGCVTYTWSPSATLNSSNSSNVEASPLATIIYTISGSSLLGCIGSATTQVDVIATPTITINQTPNGTIPYGNTAQLLATSSANSYSWNPTFFLSCSTCSNPITSTSITTTYCLTSFNAQCSNSLCIIVEIEKPCATNLTLGLPNAFSPNGDGVNDEYCLQGWNDCVTSFSILIFDRWGEKVFETTNPNFCWDGTYKGKILDPAVFVYYAKAIFISGSDFNKQGNITLVR